MTDRISLIIGIVAIFALSMVGAVLALVFAPQGDATPTVAAVFALATPMLGLMGAMLMQMQGVRRDVAEVKAVGKENSARISETAVGIEETKTAVEETRHDVRKIEIATNSMKDALVAAREEVGLLQGRVEGAAAERANPQMPAIPPKPSNEDSPGRTN